MRIRACAALIENGKILTMVYNYPKGRVYALPGGGVKEGESIVAAIEREYREELGIEIEVGDLWVVGEMMARANIPQTLHLVFKGNLKAGEPLLNPDYTSASQCLWIDLKSVGERGLYPDISAHILNEGSKGTPATARFIGDCMRRDWF